MEYNDEGGGVEGVLVNSKAGTYQLYCISEALADGPSRTYLWCQNIVGLQFPPPRTAVESTDTTPTGNRRIGEITKAAVRCIILRVHAHVALNYILRDLESLPRQILPAHPAYAEREERECGGQGYSGRPLSTRLASWAETIPHTVNGGSAECFKTGHVNSDFRFFPISVKRGKGGHTLTATFRIVMRTYPMEIPSFSLQPATIVLLL